MSRCESHGWPLLFSSPDDRTGENRVPDGRWYAIRALNQAYMLIYRAMHSVTLGAAIACNDVSGPCLRAFLVKRAVMESSDDCWRSYGIGCPDHRAWLGQCPSIPQYAWTQHPGHCLLLISINKHAAGVLTTTARQICQICGRSAQIAQIRQPVWSHLKPLAHPRTFTFPEQGSEMYTHSQRASIRRANHSQPNWLRDVHPSDVVLRTSRVGIVWYADGELSRSNIVTA